MPRKGIFISYSSKDGDALAAELRETFEQHDLSVWQNIVKMEGGRDWWQQITEALDQVEYMVLVATPASMDSRVVRKEWRYGRQQGVCVYPVYSPDNAPDFDAMPNWMRNTHFYNYGEPAQKKKLLEDLNTTCTTPRVPFMADDLPEDFVNRPAEFEALMSRLLDADRDNPVAITTALRGAGGYGKTTLARAICHDEEIQQAFDDGILWVTLGENPGDMTARLKELITILKPDIQVDATSPEAIKTLLREIMADRDILVVVDDVWKQQDLNPFLNLGEQVALLVTTRYSDTLPLQIEKIDVDEMKSDEAIDLLAANLSLMPEQRQNLLTISQRLGEWPLLLKLVNRQLYVEINDYHTPFDQALEVISQSLDDYGLTVFDADAAVGATLESSMRRLQEDERELYAMLSIFPDDVDIPLATVIQFWSKRWLDVRRIVQNFHRDSLLLDLNLETQTLRFHDVVRTYLQEQNASFLTEWHEKLLDSYNIESWADLAEDEPYMWNWLVYHLVEARRIDELLATMMDGNYLARKTYIHRDGALAVERDLVIASQELPDNRSLEMLKLNYVNIGHILSRIATLSEIEATLLYRLQHLDDLRKVFDNLTLQKPYIEPIHTLPDLPHPALIRTLSGHTDRVNRCEVSPDGTIIVSASNDNTIKVWDVATGAEVHSLTGHTLSVNSCAISPDGSFIVSASSDTTLKIWDTATGAELRTLAGHVSAVEDCAISPDGLFIASSSTDRTIKVWDTATVEELLTLRGHKGTVDSCDFSPDGVFIVSTSRNEELKIWDAATGEELHNIIGHPDGPINRVRGFTISPDGSFVVLITSDGLKVWDAESGTERISLNGNSPCAISQDSSFIVSGSEHNTLKVWDSVTGAELGTLSGHIGWVRDCAISPDGSFIVSASRDNTLKIWDNLRPTKTEVASLSKHFGEVRDCAISPDESFVVTVSEDNTLKVWDIVTGEEVRTLTGYNKRVNNCAISPDGTLIVSTADRSLFIRDAVTGEDVRTITHSFGILAGCAFSPDGKFVVAAASKRIFVWDTASGAEIHNMSGHSSGVNSCAVSSDGSFIVSGSQDVTVRLWDTASGKELRKMTGHTNAVKSCAISPDRSFIVSASNDGTLRVWDITTGAEVYTLTEHTDAVNDCAISPDGALILSASDDGTLKVWDYKNGGCVRTFYADGRLTCCDWSSDGETIVAGNNSGGVYFLRFVH